MNQAKKNLQLELYGNQTKYLVAVDNVILGYHDGQLKVLLYPRSFEPSIGNWSLLGGFIQKGESANQAAERILKYTTGLSDIYMNQVAVFSEPRREESTRVISLVFYALIQLDVNKTLDVSSYGAKWFPLDDYPELIFDHKAMIDKALESVMLEASANLLGSHLLPQLFTIKDLRDLYEAIYQRELDPGNFRKKVLSLGVLKRHDVKNYTDSKKGAFYYEYIGDEEGRDNNIIGQIVKKNNN